MGMAERAIIERATDAGAVKAPGAEERETSLATRERSALTQRAVDALADRTIGPEYNERIETLKLETNEFGVDAFGVDPDYLRIVGLIAAGASASAAMRGTASAAFNSWFGRSSIRRARTTTGPSVPSTCP